MKICLIKVDERDIDILNINAVENSDQVQFRAIPLDIQIIFVSLNAFQNTEISNGLEDKKLEKKL